MGKKWRTRSNSSRWLISWPISMVWSCGISSTRRYPTHLWSSRNNPGLSVSTCPWCIPQHLRLSMSFPSCLESQDSTIPLISCYPLSVLLSCSRSSSPICYPPLIPFSSTMECPMCSYRRITGTGHGSGRPILESCVTMWYTEIRNKPCPLRKWTDGLSTIQTRYWLGQSRKWQKDKKRRIRKENNSTKIYPQLMPMEIVQQISL